MRQALAASHGPDGFNIGVNDGEAAGQTVGHAHIHVIPRYAGDVPDPRGGIRWVGRPARLGRRTGESMIHAVPSAEAQLEFIRKLRRLLDEGSFVATYKYALLHAIADLCVTQGDDTGAPLTITTRDLADR